MAGPQRPALLATKTEIKGVGDRFFLRDYRISPQINGILSKRGMLANLIHFKIIPIIA
jgi:hypothetical protein